MDCNDARLLIDERVQGVLAQTDAARLDEHLGACAACAQDLKQLTKTRELLVQAREDAPPAGELARIWAQVAGTPLLNAGREAHARPTPYQTPFSQQERETIPESEDAMSHAATAPVVLRPGSQRARSRWRLVAVSALVAAALLLVSFQVGQMGFKQREGLVAKNQRTVGGEMGAPPAQGFFSGKLQEKNDKVVPSDILAQAEARDHLETSNSDRPASESAFENPNALMRLSDEWKDDEAGGGGGPGSSLDDLIGAGGMKSQGTGGGVSGRDGAGKRLNAPPAKEPSAPKAPALKNKKDANEPLQDEMPDKLPQRSGEGKQDVKSSTKSGTAEIDRPKIIKTGELTVEVKSYVEAGRKADELVVKFQGFVADSRTLDRPGGTRCGTIVIRIAPEKFEELYAELKKIGTVLNERAGGQDITAAYVDAEARIKNLQVAEERLQDLIKSKTFLDKIESLLAVERELSRVRGEIEGYQGQMRVWKDQIGLSTIRVTIQEPERAVPSGSLSVEVGSLADAKKTLDAALSNVGGQLLSGQTSKREDGTLMGTYGLRVKFGRFSELVGGIKGLGRTQDERVVNQPFGAAAPEGAADVPCELALVLFERSVQLPNMQIGLEVKQLGDAMKQLSTALAAAQGSVISNQTRRNPDGSAASDIQIRVRAGSFQGLLDALPMLGRVLHRVVQGEAGLVQGGAAEVPCTVALSLHERPQVVPTGQMELQVEKFTEGRDKLSALIKDQDIQVLASSSARRADGTWTATFKLGIKAGQMDLAISQLEGLGRVKTRQGQGLGLGDLAKADPGLIGEVLVFLEEMPKQVPKGRLLIEVDKFEESREKLSALIKEKELQILDRNLSKRDGMSLGSFKLGVKAGQMDVTVDEIEKLGRVKTREGEGLGLNDIAKLDASVMGEITVQLQERPALAPQEEGSFRLMLRDTFGGFLSSMGYIIRGLGTIVPWLALFGLLILAVLRWQRKKEAAEAAAVPAETPAPPAPAPKTPVSGASETPTP